MENALECNMPRERKTGLIRISHIPLQRCPSMWQPVQHIKPQVGCLVEPLSCGAQRSGTAETSFGFQSLEGETRNESQASGTAAYLQVTNVRACENSPTCYIRLCPVSMDTDKLATSAPWICFTEKTQISLLKSDFKSITTPGADVFHLNLGI